MKAWAKRLLVAVLWSALGRRNLVRLARLLTNASRLDVPNDMDSNGELLVQREALKEAPSNRPVVVFDVGANVGLWTRALAAHSGERANDLLVYAFEPCSSTAETLKSNIESWGLQGRVRISRSALSSSRKTGVMYCEGAGAGRNSLYALHGQTALSTETIECETLEEVCRSEALDHLDLVKIDTEGHDLEVLRGARGMLSRRAITMVQFEYNARWIDARCFLRDAFAILEEFGYRVGKVTPMGIEFYASWDPELESFREANFVGVVPALAERLPRIPWWNAPQEADR